MIKLRRALKASPLRVRLALTFAVCGLAACSQGSSTSNTAGDASGMDNSLADAPPPTTALPLATGPAPAYHPAPVANALPPAPSAPLGSVPAADQYAYLNQAYDFSQSLADAPPDYGYDYQGEEPWVWQSPDGDYRVAERLALGVRYFYYAHGASTPYFVQDPQYSYGYSGGRLTVVYGPDGKVLPYDIEARQAAAAGLYLAWAARLYAAARHDPHVAVSAARWDRERQAVYADQARWTAAHQRNTDWTAYSRAHQDDQAHWAAQRFVRAAEAARFAEAVHDPNALAHAQHAAIDARAIAQSHGERPPGPALESAPGHARDQTPGRTATDVEAQRHAERPHADQGGAEALPQHEAATSARRQAVADTHHEPVEHQPAPVRSTPPQIAPPQVDADRRHAESHRQPPEQAPAERPPRPAAEAPKPPQPQTHAPDVRPPPRPAPPPAKPKPEPKRDDPHP